MRLIGHLSDESQARIFGDYLLVSGFENTVEHDPPSGWGIWIAEEDRIDTAKSLLEDFRKSPEASRYQEAATGASAIRTGKRRDQARWESKVKGRRTLFRQTLASGLAPLTLVLIVLSVIAYILLHVPGRGHAFLEWLFISGYGPGAVLPEVRSGQVWRLITPIFLHFGILHILFNMLWLRDLGGAIEGRLGTAYLAWLVLALAVGSNLAQYFMGGSPNFGGMSGVVYGLLGYIWIRGKLDPACGFFLHPSTMMMMLLWFGAAFTGVLGNVANWAHAGGLILGMAIGYMEASRSH